MKYESESKTIAVNRLIKIMSINYSQNSSVWEKFDKKHLLVLPNERQVLLEQAIRVLLIEMKRIHKISEEYQWCWVVYVHYRLELTQLLQERGNYVSSI